MSSPEHNMAVVQAAFDAINAGDYEALKATVTHDFVRHDLGSTFPTGNLEEFMAMINMVKAAMPDFTMGATKMIATQDDHVAALIKTEGTHIGGELLGVAPTGNRIVVRGSSMYYFVDGLIHDNWQLLDAAGLLAALNAPAAVSA